MTVFLGLTGSIGMGKSTTANMFREFKIPVHDSDATVHELYTGEAVELVEQSFPGSTKDGVVDRTALGKQVVGDENKMKKLEALIHPLVRKKELAFRKHVISQGEPLAILDVPLLFETGGETRVDGVIVVTAPFDIQKERVLARPGMDEEKFESILNRQTPDEEKRKRADFIVDSSKGLEAAKKQVIAIIKAVKNGWSDTNKGNEVGSDA